jgi:hypothetical protein
VRALASEGCFSDHSHGIAPFFAACGAPRIGIERLPPVLAFFRHPFHLQRPPLEDPEESLPAEIFPNGKVSLWKAFGIAYFDSP